MFIKQKGLILILKEFWKSVNVCRSYGQLSTGLFYLWNTVYIPWNIHDEDAAATAATMTTILGLGAILSVQRVGVSWVRTVRPCGYNTNRILSYFGCCVFEI